MHLEGSDSPKTNRFTLDVQESTQFNLSVLGKENIAITIIICNPIVHIDGFPIKQSHLIFWFIWPLVPNLSPLNDVLQA